MPILVDHLVPILPRIKFRLPRLLPCIPPPHAFRNPRILLITRIPPLLVRLTDPRLAEVVLSSTECQYASRRPRVRVRVRLRVRARVRAIG